MARYRVLRRGITQEEYENLSRYQRQNNKKHETLVYEPQKHGIWSWSRLGGSVYLDRQSAEQRIFAEKAREELVVSEYITKDDPLYQVTNIVEN